MLPFPVPLKGRASTVPSHIKTEPIISFLAFYRHLYQHLLTLQADRSQLTVHLIGIKKPPTLARALSLVALGPLFTLWMGMAPRLTVLLAK